MVENLAFPDDAHYILADWLVVGPTEQCRGEADFHF